MITTPRNEVIPDRFGSPNLKLDAISWEKMGDNTYECRVLLCPEEEGGYSAHAIRLPGVVSQGESIEEALSNISEAFRAAVSLYTELEEDIPWESMEMDRPQGSLEKWILVNA